jgi:hypothetical protein
MAQKPTLVKKKMSLERNILDTTDTPTRIKSLTTQKRSERNIVNPEKKHPTNNISFK